MWQRFTENARRVIFFAQEEALHIGDDRVSTRHLLLALTDIPGSRAARTLALLNVDLWSVRMEVEAELEPRDPLPTQDMTLTPRGKKVIDLAYKEARGLGNNYIGTEHILLGLLREEEGLAGRVLRLLGVQVEECRDAVGFVQRRPDEDEQPLPEDQPDPVDPSFSLAELLADAFKFAEVLGQPVRSEHVLLALCERDAFSAKDILARHGVTTESLLEELRGTTDEPENPPNDAE